MGSASSVNIGENVTDGEAPSAEEFGARAQLLASKYHDLRLHGRGDVGGEGRVAPPSVLGNCKATSTALRSRSSPSPLPRAERKRLSRQLQRDEVDQKNGGRRATEIVPARGDGLGDCTEPSHIGLASEASGGVSDRGGDTAKHAAHERSQQSQFVHRDEMAGFARELGYDITPAQATGIFDILDSKGQGQISKGDIFKHFLPLLQRVGHSSPPRRGSTGRRKSSKGVSPRRPRPSNSRPSGPKTPPRPAGTPPPTAKRRVTLSPPEGPGDNCSVDPAPLSPTSPSRTEKRKGSTTTGTLDPISSPNRLRERPSKFWLKPQQNRDLDPPASTSLTPLSSEAGQVDEGQSCHNDGAEEVEKLGEGISEEVDGAKKDPIAGTTGPGEELELATGLSVIKKSAGDSDNGNNDGADDDKNAVGTSAGATMECTSKSSMGTNLKPAAVDPLHGKNVLDWAAADVLTWLRALPRGLAAFAEAEAFANGHVDGKKLATLTLSDIKRKEFRHAKFKAKVPTALWVEIKQIQLTVPSPAEAVAAAPVLPSRFAPGQTIVDEAVNTPLCTVKQSVGQGAFGEVYQVVWTGIGADRGATLAMKTTRLADISSNERDEYRVLLMEEILTAVRVKPHPNVVNVRFAHIMGFCSESEEYFCFEDFVTGRNLEELVAEGEGGLYHGTPAEVQGRLLSYSIQLARGLGHIHRCGVLHQDIKSANIMVSSDAETLITDFGFATVGHFGPPPPSAQEPRLVPPKANTADATTGNTDGVPELTGVDEAPKSTCDGVSVSSHSQTVAADDNSGGHGSTRSRGLTTGGGGENDGPDTAGSELGDDGPSSLGNTSAGVDGDMIVPAKTRAQAKQAIDSFVPATGAAPAQRSCPAARVASPSPVTQAQSATAADLTGSPPIGVGKGRRDMGGAGKGTYVAEAQASRLSIADNGRPPNRESVLYGTIKGYTPRYQSPEVSDIMEKKWLAAAATAPEPAGDRPSQTQALQDSSPPQPSKKHETVDEPHTRFTHRSDMWAAGVVILEMYAGGLAGLREARGDNALEMLDTYARHVADVTALTEESGRLLTPKGRENTRQHEGGTRATGQDGEKPRAKAGVGSGSPQRDGGTTKRITFRVDMPEGVTAVLRDIFQLEAKDRPESMEVLAARLSQTLAGMLGEKLAVVPCATSGAPSPSSLCEEAPACVECEENHAKVGRLHMWLGKALFLKGEDRRKQALQEYREGVRVLAQSKAERRSPSMALFRWYLGKALLETGEIDEALPHLAEAVSIDPESAKYRHTLGLAKCATGDEAGAREDLLEAALLDEEDAEDRYQLRIQRISEKRRKNDEQQRKMQESQALEGAGGSQHKGASSPEPEDSETGKPQQATTPPKNDPPGPTSTLSQSQLLALEKASVSTRTYALGKLGDYRTERGVGKGGGDYFRGGGGGTMDARRAYTSDKSVRDAMALPEVQRFSVGDEIVCEPPTFSPQHIFEPLRCCRSSYHIEAEFQAGSNEMFIDGLVPRGQASLQFPGEAYRATGITMQRRRQTSGESTDTDGGQSFHAVCVRFEPDKNTPVAAAGLALKEEENNTAVATPSGHTQLAPIDERQLTKNGANAITNSSPVGVMAAPSTGTSPGSSSRSCKNKPRGSLSPSRPLSPTNAISLRGPTHVQREEEYVPMLKAAGRAAMVGFHAQLAGAMRHLTWGPDELILVADVIPSACSTLWEACVSGSLYRGTRMISADGGRGRPKPSEDKAITSSVVVDRMLELARQTAAAISHCHGRGILLRDITPHEVLVTPQWNAILRPNYSHAHEGQSWTTVSVRKQQNAAYIDRPCSDLDDKRLMAPFTNAISSDYQSPEIARIRSENEPRQRVSGRALRLSASSSTSPARNHQEEQHPPSVSPTGRRPSASPEPTGARERGRSGSGSIVGGGGRGEGRSGAATASLGDTPTLHQESNEGSSEDQLHGDSSKRARTSRSSLSRRRGRADSTGGKLASGPSSPLGPTASTVLGGGSGEPPMISACESDIWAWALMVLQMFSDELWPPGSGQKGLPALEALLGRRKGVDAWTTDDVITWLREIGLWSEKTEREIRVFKIAGPQLLVPTCRRDIVEKLGLFIADGELSCKLWESIAGGLQRWSVPSRLAQVLRGCLADNPDDRFSTMDQVCELLHGIAAGDAPDGEASRVPTRNDAGDVDQNTASDRLRTGMILNDIGVCLCGRGLADEAERYYKMALLSSDDVVEAYYNLGLLYIAPAFNKFQEARQVFDAATERMGNQDPRRKASVEHSKAAERKSNYHQSQEMMKALSGKYSSVSPKGNRQRGSGGGTISSATRRNPSGGGTISDDDNSRRASFPPAHTSNKPLERLSASIGTASSSGIGLQRTRILLD